MVPCSRAERETRSGVSPSPVRCAVMCPRTIRAGSPARSTQAPTRSTLRVAANPAAAQWRSFQKQPPSWPR